MPCKDCRWWKIEESKNQANSSVLGRCKKRSPSVSAVVMPVMKSQLTREIVPQIIEVTSWPLPAGETEVCGDFESLVGPLKIPTSLLKMRPEGKAKGIEDG